MAVTGDNIFVAGKDVIFGSTQSTVHQRRDSKGRGIGSAEISDTERFHGYYQNKENGYADQTVYKGSVIGSEKGNIQVYAGGKYVQESSALLAKDGKVAISAASVESIAHDNVSLTGNRTSDTKIGGFAKVSSPLIDLVNTARSAKDTVEDNKATDRMKAMKGAVLALQGYGAVSDLAQGVLMRAEVSTGIKHAHADYHEQAIQGQGNAINGAKGVEIIAREGKIDLKQMDITTTKYNPDKQINEVSKGSYVYLDGKQGINISSGRDEFHAKGRQTGYGLQVGAGAQVGAQTGAYAFAEVGYNNAKQQTDINNKQNSHIATEHLILKSGGDVNMQGASAYVKRLDADIQGDLNVISEQSFSSQKSSGSNFGLRVQISFGTAWSVGGNFSSNKGSSNHVGVLEQAGFFVGDGGYNVKANKLDLTGGALLSTAPKDKNVLNVKEFSFKDIQNYSQAKASSLALMGGFSVKRDQTSIEDKALNEQYRKEVDPLTGERKARENADGSPATFEQANINQQKASALKFGLSNSDVHSTDFYAAAKLGLVNALGNAKASESHSSVTKAVISEGVFNIESESGKAAMEKITKIKGEMLNPAELSADSAAVGKASSLSNPLLNKADLETMVKKAEIKTEFNKELLKIAAGQTDEAYRSQFIAEHRMMGYVTDKNGKPVRDQERLNKLKEDAAKEAKKKGLTDEKEIAAYIKDYSEKAINKGYNIYQLYELSDEQRQNLQKTTYVDPNTGKEVSKYVVAFNGIMNDHQAAAKFAVQNYVAGKNPQTGEIDQRIYKDVYFVHNPKAKGFAELLVAVYQKTLEGNIGGLGNSTLQAVDLMKRYGKDDLFIGSHSRGTLTVTNALSALNTKENQDKELLSGTDMKMVGPAASLVNADNKLNALQGFGEKRTSSERSIRVENHEADLVGNWWIVGNNPDSGLKTNNLNRNWAEKIADIFSNERTSSHNCYGLGQPQCMTDGYRDKGDLRMHPEKTVYELVNPKK